MQKLNWQLFEEWAIAKYNQFGGDDWLDLVLLCAGKKAEEER